MSRIILAQTDEEIHAASTLFQEYAASLRVDLSFQNFDHELATLPGDYAPPAGRLLLALCDDHASGTAQSDTGRPTKLSPASFLAQGLAGCIALRRFEGDSCEMKRLYVRPQFRGKGVGRELAEAVIGAACEIGYRVMLLDTLPQMRQAQNLYRALGFREILPYRHNPVAGSLYFELRL